MNLDVKVELNSEIQEEFMLFPFRNSLKREQITMSQAGGRFLPLPQSQPA
jgi:hypothetical protein